jgi:glycosyltransferase involved in cell wall biosynthesis
MRIVYISNDWIAKGACAVFSTYNVWGIARNNIDTHLFVRNVSQGDTKALFRNVFNLEYPDNLTLHRINKRFKKANAEYYWKVAGKIRKMNDENTVVITRTTKVLPYLLMIPKRKFSIYYETHNFFYDLKLRDDLKKRRVSYYKNAVQDRLTLNKIDGLVCLTNTQKKLWEQYLELPIHVIYPGLLSPSYGTDNYKGVNLAYTGSLDPGRGIDQIFELARYLPANYSVFIFGGRKKNDLEMLQNLVQEKNIEQKITITGWIDQYELQRRLDKMHLGLLPLKNNFFNRYLTAPSKLFDYLSHSLPSVASSLPALQELVEDNKLGITVNWDHPAEVASSIVHFMNDMDSYKNMKERIYSFALEHTWEKRGEKIVKTLFD